MWAVKIDLKHAYFHLPVAEDLEPYLRFNVGDQVYQYQAACFGLSSLPYLWMSLMKVFQKLWRGNGILCFIYLDDILVLGQSQLAVSKSLAFILQSLSDSGMTVNQSKSTLVPTQSVDHLGFRLDLHRGVLMVPPAKFKSVRRELGKLVCHGNMSCRKMAAILGQVRSFLTAMPFLRAFTDKMLLFVRRHQFIGWDHPLEVPSELRQEVLNVNVNVGRVEYSKGNALSEVLPLTAPIWRGVAWTPQVDSPSKTIGGRNRGCTSM